MPDFTSTLKPGDVITIEHFNMQNLGGKDKLIWSVYMGMDSILECQIFVYFCRTTTQKDDFKTGGKRESHKYKEFKKGQYGFEDDCILDFDERPYNSITKEKFNSFTIVYKGHLPDNIVQEIYSKCIKRYLYGPQLISVRDSLSKVGIKIK